MYLSISCIYSYISNLSIIYLPFSLSIYLYLYIFLSIYIYVYIYLSIYLSIYPFKIQGGRPEQLTSLLSKEYIVRKSLIRTTDGFSEKVSDTLSAKYAYFPSADQIVSDKVEAIMLNQKEAMEAMEANRLKAVKGAEKAKRQVTLYKLYKYITYSVSVCIVTG